jgi:hypothetical protein
MVRGICTFDDILTFALLKPRADAPARRNAAGSGSML